MATSDIPYPQLAGDYSLHSRLARLHVSGTLFNLHVSVLNVELHTPCSKKSQIYVDIALPDGLCSTPKVDIASLEWDKSVYHL